MRKLYLWLLAFSGILITFLGLVFGSWISQYNSYLSFIAVPIGCFGFIIFIVHCFKATFGVKKE